MGLAVRALTPLGKARCVYVPNTRKNGLCNKTPFRGILQAPETSSKPSHCLHTAEVALVRSQHRPLRKDVALQVKRKFKERPALTPSLFYTSPITAAPTSAAAAPAPGPVAGRGPCGTAASGSGA